MTATAQPLRQRLVAEALGAVLLTATVVGSGIMAARLAGGNAAVALLANTAATVSALAALIALLGPVSGAHFNPAVSFIEALRRQLSWADAVRYVAATVRRIERIICRGVRPRAESRRAPGVAAFRFVDRRGPRRQPVCNR